MLRILSQIYIACIVFYLNMARAAETCSNE